MTFLELVWNTIKYVIIVPLVMVVGLLYFVVIMIFGIILSPIVVILSLFDGYPYLVFEESFDRILSIAAIVINFGFKLIGG